MTTASIRKLSGIVNTNGSIFLNPKARYNGTRQICA
jgi:hypothetical protein